MTGLRPVAPLKFPSAKPAVIVGAPPQLRIAKPTELYVDARYQRDLSLRSADLIRRIVEHWDWNAFKPPVVAEDNGILQIIDGQHTAIAAATHGGISEIPILVTAATELADRAGAFVRHNRDRVAVSALQIHKAMVTAGDETALTIAQVCERAGVTVLASKPDADRYRPGDTMALASIRRLVSRRYAIGARRVLDICVKTGAAPIAADMIKAVETLLFEPEFKGEISDDQIVKVLSASLSTLAQDSHNFAVQRHMPRWRAVAALVMSRSTGGTRVAVG